MKKNENSDIVFLFYDVDEKNPSSDKYAERDLQEKFIMDNEDRIIKLFSNCWPKDSISKDDYNIQKNKYRFSYPLTFEEKDSIKNWHREYEYRVIIHNNLDVQWYFALNNNIIVGCCFLTDERMYKIDPELNLFKNHKGNPKLTEIYTCIDDDN